MKSYIARGQGNLRVTALAAAVLAALLGGTITTTQTANAVASCGAFGSVVYDQVNPKTRAQTLTIGQTQARAMKARGYTVNRGTPLRAAGRSGSGLTAVHRLYRARSGTYFYSLDRAEIKRAVTRYGYRDHGIAFYASTVKLGCLVGVTSSYRNGIHRFVTLPGERAILTDQGWKPEKIRFYVAPAAVDSAFTMAVMPDTQQEVFSGTRFINRSRWLVSQRAALDLKFVTHGGDVVNWDTPRHEQYQRAKDALAPLRAARIPYSLTIGNHDTAAVGPGGSAIDPPNTYRLIRGSQTFNRYLGQGTAAMRGQFERGKVDNIYSTFSGGNAQWLVLNLEMWPRKGVVAWARTVVAAHPRHNVIVVTHSYLTSTGGIHQRVEYGATSPQYLYDNLIKVYPNVRMVFSAHVGTAATRVDTGVNGNRITSFLLAMHSNTTNPVRLVEIDTQTQALRSWVFAPYTRQRYPSFSREFTVTRWIR